MTSLAKHARDAVARRRKPGVWLITFAALGIAALIQLTVSEGSAFGSSASLPAGIRQAAPSGFESQPVLDWANFEKDVATGTATVPVSWVGIESARVIGVSPEGLVRAEYATDRLIVGALDPERLVPTHTYTIKIRGVSTDADARPVTKTKDILVTFSWQPPRGRQYNPMTIFGTGFFAFGTLLGGIVLVRRWRLGMPITVGGRSVAPGEIGNAHGESFDLRSEPRRPDDDPAVPTPIVHGVSTRSAALDMEMSSRDVPIGEARASAVEPDSAAISCDRAGGEGSPVEIATEVGALKRGDASDEIAEVPLRPTPRHPFEVRRVDPPASSPTARWCRFQPDSEIAIVGSSLDFQNADDHVVRCQHYSDGARGCYLIVPPLRFYLSVFTEKKLGRGEDAQPTVLVNKAGDAVIGVYDGLGGAGSRPAIVSENGNYNQAFVASRLVKQGVEEWFRHSIETGEMPEADELQRRLSNELNAAVADSLPVASGVAKSSLYKDLPTTVALLTSSKGTVRAHWAGDSRAFLFDPASGLQQLTADHVRNSDVLDQLRNDSPMSNVVSASKPFRLESVEVAQPKTPSILMCATDGFFGYVKTPGQAEFVLLDTLMESADLREWARKMAERLQTYTADDATIVMYGQGFGSFKAMQKDFAPRYAYVTRTQFAPFDDLDPTDEAAFGAARQEAWEEYRTGYLARMPVRNTEVKT
jgi:serine/threonine protein phosphatase PrpC